MNSVGYTSAPITATRGVELPVRRPPAGGWPPKGVYQAPVLSVNGTGRNRDKPPVCALPDCSKRVNGRDRKYCSHECSSVAKRTTYTGCTEPGCYRTLFASGLCRRHYREYREGGTDG